MEESDLGHWQPACQSHGDARTDLAYNLNRPHMNQGDAVHKYEQVDGNLYHFGPGAFLKRHTGKAP
jgi:hypothetical protein